jgi:uncharacterized protein (DUF433 family)
MSGILEIGSLIVASNDVRGGRPRIAGTGVTVQRIVRWYRLGLTPEEIVDRIEHINLAQVFAALSYYHANQTLVEAEIAADDAAAEMAEIGETNRSAP